MNEKRQEWLFWGAVTILIAAIVHLGTVWLLPRVVMMRALDRLGTPNTMHVGHRPDATSRTIVRPSPDILYATCPYDLSKGPLRLTAPVVRANYWSVSAFDGATNNFFVKNDQQTTGNSLEVLVIRRGQTWPALDNAVERVILFSPSERGLLLIRAVIDSDKHLPALEAALNGARCGTVASAKKLR
ncbi:MAG TPA: DUF1254 domain-containing protein [Rhizomicrobium sp.]|nr:DUF1254 domain-containing protein [Rhizomicrobium sp.]